VLPAVWRHRHLFHIHTHGVTPHVAAGACGGHASRCPLLLLLLVLLLVLVHAVLLQGSFPSL
jgi:hypothetical protein